MPNLLDPATKKKTKRNPSTLKKTTTDKPDQNPTTDKTTEETPVSKTTTEASTSAFSALLTTDALKSLATNAVAGVDQAASRKAAESLISGLRASLGDRYPTILAADDNIAVLVWTTAINQLLVAGLLPLSDDKVEILKARIDAAQTYASAQLAEVFIAPLFQAINGFVAGE